MFCTNLGYTNGLKQVLLLEPITASITFTIYYFNTIMLLINMMTIIVKSEYNRQIKIKKEQKLMKKKFTNPFVFTPFFVINVIEKFYNFFCYKIWKWFDYKRYKELKAKKMCAKLSKKIMLRNFYNIDFDIEFEKISDIQYKKSNSMTNIAKISKNDIKK